MKIDGRAIAERIYQDLSDQVDRLHIVPTLAVIQVGDNEASTTYINQKKKAAEKIGAHLIHTKFSETVSAKEINRTIEQYNNNPSIHGIILQRPLPTPLVTHASINMDKDVDGFELNSPYTPPVTAAVLIILNEVYTREKEKQNANEETFDAWLKNQCSVVLGRGETAGKPISRVLQEKGCLIEVVHTKSTHPEAVVKKMPIVVSCVGKERVITKDMVTKDTILIGVGIWRDSEGKLRGDYNEDEIKNIVAYYTPTPGGVGPVNVASLMQNLVKACTMQTGGKP